LFKRIKGGKKPMEESNGDEPEYITLIGEEAKDFKPMRKLTVEEVRELWNKGKPITEVKDDG
jgi:hypothetical protein